jgi:hypothetical protein
MNFLIGMAGISLALGMTVIGCDQGTGGGTGPRNGGVLTINKTRYETVANTSPEPEIIDSYTDGTYNYYLIHPGYVKLVPIAYGAADDYNGVTPIEVSFSRTEEIGSIVTNSVTSCVSRTVTNSNTQEFSAGLKVGTTFAGVVDAELEAKWKGSWTNAEAKSYSTTSTHTTAESYATKNTDTKKYTIGNNGEAVGKYRHTLIATCDIYLFLKLNANNTQVVEALTSAYARQASYTYVIDYDPDTSGEFKKNSSSNSIKVDPDFYKTLRVPTNKEPIVTPPVVEPTAYYTETRTNDLDHVGSSSSDETISPKFSMESLKSLGYNKVRIDVSYRFKAEEILGGDLRLQVANADKSSELGHKDAGPSIFSDMSWRDGSYSVTASIDSLKSPTCDFTLLWSKTGWSKYCVGIRTITITAIK